MPAPAAYFLHAPPAHLGAIDVPHWQVAIAEGLKEFGWTILGPRAEQRGTIDGQCLFSEASGSHAAEADLVVVDCEWEVATGRPLPNWLLTPNRRFLLVGIDHDDVSGTSAWHRRPSQRGFDLVFRCHASARYPYAENVRPWAFGLTSRIIWATEPQPVGRIRRLVWNFNHKTYPHTVRLEAEREFLRRASEVIPVDRSQQPADLS